MNTTVKASDLSEKEKSGIVEQNLDSLEKIVENIKDKVSLTNQYLIAVGKSFIQLEYEDMGIKFVDKPYSEKYYR